MYTVLIKILIKYVKNIKLVQITSCKNTYNINYRVSYQQMVYSYHYFLGGGGWLASMGFSPLIPTLPALELKEKPLDTPLHCYPILSFHTSSYPLQSIPPHFSDILSFASGPEHCASLSVSDCLQVAVSVQCSC
jgi:hypothetical protein